MKTTRLDARQAQDAGQGGPGRGDGQRQGEVAVAGQQPRGGQHGRGRLLGHRRQHLPQQQHGGGLVAHVAVVAHGEAWAQRAKTSTGPARPQRGGEPGRERLGHDPLAGIAAGGADAEPERLARPVAERAAHARRRTSSRAAHTAIDGEMTPVIAPAAPCEWAGARRTSPRADHRPRSSRSAAQPSSTSAPCTAMRWGAHIAPTPPADRRAARWPLEAGDRSPARPAPTSIGRASCSRAIARGVGRLDALVPVGAVSSATSSGSPPAGGRQSTARASAPAPAGRRPSGPGRRWRPVGCSGARPQALARTRARPPRAARQARRCAAVADGPGRRRRRRRGGPGRRRPTGRGGRGDLAALRRRRAPGGRRGRRGDRAQRPGRHRGPAARGAGLPGRRATRAWCGRCWPACGSGPPVRGAGGGRPHDGGRRGRAVARAPSPSAAPARPCARPHARAGRRRVPRRLPGGRGDRGRRGAVLQPPARPAARARRRRPGAGGRRRRGGGGLGRPRRLDARRRRLAAAAHGERRAAWAARSTSRRSRCPPASTWPVARHLPILRLPPGGRSRGAGGRFGAAGLACARVGTLDGSGRLRLAAGGEEAEVWDLGEEPLTGMGPS